MSEQKRLREGDSSVLSSHPTAKKPKLSTSLDPSAFSARLAAISQKIKSEARPKPIEDGEETQRSSSDRPSLAEDLRKKVEQRRREVRENERIAQVTKDRAKKSSESSDVLKMLESIPSGPTPSLSLNVEMVKKEEKIKEKQREQLQSSRMKEELEAKRAVFEATKKTHFDPRLGTTSIHKALGRRRMRSSFAFVEPGSIVRRGDRLRERISEMEKERRSRLVEQVPDEPEGKEADGLDGKSGGVEELSRMAVEGTTGDAQKEKKSVMEWIPRLSVAPNVEWWDASLIQNDETYPSLKGKSDELELGAEILRRITSNIEHPAPIDPLRKRMDSGADVLMLTKKERKKWRRQRRMQREKEKQDKIAAGLIAPPPPKVKLSNIMRVYGAQASSNPTAILEKVKREVEARQRKHEKMNEERKLGPDQKREKKIRKLEKDAGRGTFVHLYSVKDLSHGKHQFKIDKNAQQLKLSGCAIITEDISFVIAEGGPHAMQFLEKLMMRRMKWQKTEESEDLPEKNECRLVWKGEVISRAFTGFRLQSFRSMETVKKYLKDLGVSHYVDILLRSEKLS